VRFDVTGRFRAVIDGTWKLVFTPGQTGDLEYDLFDLAADPGERRDLYAEDHPRARALRALLAGWLRDAPAAGRATPSASDLERLRALGYVE
jgi:hypothetical protein